MYGTRWRWISIVLLSSASCLQACGGGGGGGAPRASVGGAPSGAPQADPLRIWGAPQTSVVADTHYVFEPGATGYPGDILLFEIVNQPPWADFDATTGRLFGVPGAADVGNYQGIRITVGNGRSSAALPAFSIVVEPIGVGTATLSWQAPMTNVDGTPLIDLAGYRVLWGRGLGNVFERYTESALIMNPGITTYIVDNLGRGVYFFVVTAVTASGLESPYSNQAMKIIR